MQRKIPEDFALLTQDAGYRGEDAETGQKLFALGAANARIWTVARSPNGERLAVASYTTQVRDAHDGKELLTLRAHRVASTVVWSPNGKQLATGSECNEANVWDA